MLNFRRKKFRSYEINPDEVMLDSRNSPQFNSQQFEGRMEKPIRKRSVVALGAGALLVMVVIVSKLWSLQIVHSAYYADRSVNNSFNQIPVFADRGVIYDRYKKELVWNIESPEGETFSHRDYIKEPGFSHILGYVSYPSRDDAGIFWSTEFAGKDGLEKQYNDILRGTNGVEFVEVDVHGAISSRNISEQPRSGENLTTTIDAGLQTELYKSLQHLIDSGSFSGGSGVIMDIKNGDILAMTSAPEYSSAVLSDGSDRETISHYMTDSHRVFLNRAISGLYTPGSIVKPFVAIGALAEDIVNPYKNILSTGSISLPNPYNPKLETVFKDWKAHGWVDMREAIAVSSDVYFYEIGGGFKDQKGIGILNIDKYNKMFGVGVKTGIDLPGEVEGNIPTPDWKVAHFKGDPWRVGDTYHTAIGQYGFQVTPIEMVRATAAIANGGTLVTPHLLLGREAPTSKIDISADHFKVVQEGMRLAVTEGTAVAANVPYVKVAAKTGTAQLGALKNRVNSWAIGFFPYDNPKYAFAILAESAPKDEAVGAITALRGALDWMRMNQPGYLDLSEAYVPPADDSIKDAPEEAIPTTNTVPVDSSIDPVVDFGDAFSTNSGTH